MVGHTGMDISAVIRRQVLVLDKQSQKKDVLGYRITNGGHGDTMQVAEEVLDLKSIPATRALFDNIDDEGIEIKYDEDAGESAEDGIVETPKCQATTNSAGSISKRK